MSDGRRIPAGPRMISVLPAGDASPGGPNSFKLRITRGLTAHGLTVVDRYDPAADAVLVVAGTRRLFPLVDARRRDIPVVQRLDGINWRHRFPGDPLKQRAVSIVRNQLLFFIRDRLATHIVYQSEFVRDWWHRWRGASKVREHVIYNAAPPDLFAVQPAKDRAERPVLLCVEGNLPDDTITEQAIRTVHGRLRGLGSIAETWLVGNSTEAMRRRMSDVEALRFLGPVAREALPNIFAQAVVFLSLDINPACPNSVIESLAAGVPVVCFSTGALAELVSSEAGVCVPYGADPWNLEMPDVVALADAAEYVVASQQRFSAGARNQANKRFRLEQMVGYYHEVLCDSTEQRSGPAGAG